MACVNICICNCKKIEIDTNIALNAPLTQSLTHLPFNLPLQHTPPSPHHTPNPNPAPPLLFRPSAPPHENSPVTPPPSPLLLSP